MDKEQVRAWRDGWRRVNEYEIEELRRTPMETRFRQLASMMQTARVLGWRGTTPEEIERVRQLWVRLKKHHQDPHRQSTA